MITRIRAMIAKAVALVVVLCTFGLVRVDWTGGTVEQARERAGREPPTVVENAPD